MKRRRHLPALFLLPLVLILILSLVLYGCSNGEVEEFTESPSTLDTTTSTTQGTTTSTKQETTTTVSSSEPPFGIEVAENYELRHIFQPIINMPCDVDVGLMELSILPNGVKEGLSW